MLAETLNRDRIRAVYGSDRTIAAVESGSVVLRKYSIALGLAVTTGSGRSPWHYESMVSLLKIAGLLVEDAFRWVMLLFRSAEALRADDLFLHR